MKSKDIVVLAVFAALTAVLALFPFVFLIPLIVGSIILGKAKGFILSVIFGIISLAYSFTMGMSFVGIVFRENPWLPVVARLPIGFVCAWVFGSLKGKLKGGAVPVAAVAASILNTIAVVGFMALAIDMHKAIGDAGVTLYIAIPEMLISGVIEVCIVAAVSLPLVKATELILFGKRSRFVHVAEGDGNASAESAEE